MCIYQQKVSIEITRFKENEQQMWWICHLSNMLPYVKKYETKIRSRFFLTVGQKTHGMSFIVWTLPSYL